MSETTRTLEALFRQWREPQRVMYEGAPSEMLFRCVPNEPCVEIVSLGLTMPDDLSEAWSVCCGCRLFEDAIYGQWGLELFSPSEALRETNEYRAEREDRDDPAEVGDLVIGRFIGDLQRLMIRCETNAADFGSVVVVAEIDPRSEWVLAAPTLAVFLSRYAAAQGRKCWEDAGNGQA
jgi:hypothetical protein